MQLALPFVARYWWELEVSRTCSLERVALLPLVRVNANVVERAANVQSGKKRMGEYEGGPFGSTCSLVIRAIRI